MPKYYHIISDDSYWLTAEAKFSAKATLPAGLTRAATLAEGGLLGIVPDIVDLPDLDALRGCLDFYNFPLGELAGPDDKLKQFREAVAQRLDAFALEKGWDSIDRVLNQKGAFADDAIAAQKVYDDMWLAAFALEEQIMAGTISVADVLASLPEMKWPES